MNPPRFVRVLALAALCLAPLAAQESAEVASLRAKAQRGNAIAQYNLGLAYAKGRGIAQNNIEAFVWLSLAIENGARGKDLEALVGSFDSATLERAAGDALAQVRAEQVGKQRDDVVLFHFSNLAASPRSSFELFLCRCISQYPVFYFPEHHFHEIGLRAYPPA